MGRRWSELFEAGLSCSQDVADRLVRDVIINGPDRHLEGAADAQAVASAMIDVLADVREGLADIRDLGWATDSAVCYTRASARVTPATIAVAKTQPRTTSAKATHWLIPAGAQTLDWLRLTSGISCSAVYTTGW
jgi:hypothetical protein